MTIQERTWEIVEAGKPSDTASRVFDITILTLILLNVIASIAGTVQSIHERWGESLEVFEAISVVVFTFEYLVRMWSCVTSPRFRRPVSGRIWHSVQPMSIIDLLAILPFYLPFVGIDLRSLRVLRLFRIFRVAKIGRYYSTLNVITDVIRSKREELVLTSILMSFLLVVSASLLYYCENAAQPELFSSIPATMWWSVTTLTSVGYGDMYPVTVLGKICASVIAILGIGMFALPTGILGAGFIEAIAKKKDQQVCPHCGKELH
ncbi:MAG: ion transporter [Planctomycetaceae bacterium]